MQRDAKALSGQMTGQGSTQSLATTTGDQSRFRQVGFGLIHVELPIRGHRQMMSRNRKEPWLTRKGPIVACKRVFRGRGVNSWLKVPTREIARFSGFRAFLETKTGLQGLSYWLFISRGLKMGKFQLITGVGPKLVSEVVVYR